MASTFGNEKRLEYVPLLQSLLSCASKNDTVGLEVFQVRRHSILVHLNLLRMSFLNSVV